MNWIRTAGLGLLLSSALACSPEQQPPSTADAGDAATTPATGLADSTDDEASPAAGSPRTKTLVLSGVVLWDGVGEAPLEDAAVVVRDGHILAAGPQDAVAVPADATTLDLADRFVMPGLIDSHVHYASAGTLAIDLDSADIDALLRSSRCAGITTVLAVDGSKRSREAARRAAAATDLPTVLWASGPYVAASGPDAETADWTARIRQDFDAGASLLAMAPAGPGTDWSLLARLVALSHGASRPALGFALERQQALALLDLGINRFVHTVTDQPLRSADLQAMRTAGAGMSTTAAMWLSLTASEAATGAGADGIATLEARCTAAERRRQLSDERIRTARAAAAGMGARAASAEANLRELIAAGAPLAAGSDAGTLDLTHGSGLHRELAALVALGMTPRQALLAATRDAAAFLGMADYTGTLTAGRQADLLVLERSPLKDLSALRDIHGVMVDGHWIPRDRLHGDGV